MQFQTGVNSLSIKSQRDTKYLEKAPQSISVFFSEFITNPKDLIHESTTLGVIQDVHFRGVKFKAKGNEVEPLVELMRQSIALEEITFDGCEFVVPCLHKLVDFRAPVSQTLLMIEIGFLPLSRLEMALLCSALKMNQKLKNLKILSSTSDYCEISRLGLETNWLRSFSMHCYDFTDVEVFCFYLGAKKGLFKRNASIFYTPYDSYDFKRLWWKLGASIAAHTETKVLMWWERPKDLSLKDAVEYMHTICGTEQLQQKGEVW